MAMLNKNKSRFDVLKLHSRENFCGLLKSVKVFCLKSFIVYSISQSFIQCNDLRLFFITMYTE